MQHNPAFEIFFNQQRYPFPLGGIGLEHRLVGQIEKDTRYEQSTFRSVESYLTTASQRPFWGERSPSGSCTGFISEGRVR